MSDAEKPTPAIAPAMPPIPRAATTLIAIAFAAGTIWNLIKDGPPMVTLGMASAVLFILGVPVGTALFGGRRGD